MATLPKYRVQQIKPFANPGVDFTGPLTMKGQRGRSFSSTAAYIVLFVCMTTKALHLEVSSSLSTEAFLLAFTRFIGRRGPIQNMHSDNGTNFVSTARLLNPLHDFIPSQPVQQKIQHHLSTFQINWYFNHPSSPHFGGLWEAGVKSVKSLIFRSIGSQKLTLEEFITLLIQIEATLKSEPLTALSNDVSDYEALTPSHFLTMESTTSLPDPKLASIPLSKLQRWRLVTDIHKHFWARWKSEYLSGLQLRTKWKTHGKSLNIGDLVLIKEPTPPLQWILGRIRELHPG